MSKEVATGAEGNHSGQWGLAALLMASLVLILFPMMSISILALSVASWNSDSVDRGQVEAGVISVRAVVFGIFALVVVALGCGVRGAVCSVRRRQPLGLSFAGITTGIVALIVTVVLLQITNYVIEDTHRLRAVHPRFKPADPAVVQEVEALVAKHPQLRPALDKAMEDGVMTEAEADAILGRSPDARIDVLKATRQR